MPPTTSYRFGDIVIMAVTGRMRATLALGEFGVVEL